MYDAESEFQKTFGSGRTFASKQEIQDYIDAFVAKGWVQAKFQHRAPTIEVTRLNGASQRSMAYRALGVIHISRSDMDEVSVLHEVAHCFRPKPCSASVQAAHGHEFCGMLLTFIRKQLGVAAERALQACFKKHKVRFRPKRKSTLKAGQMPAGFAALQAWKKNNVQVRGVIQ